jgi:hypothetical protein
MGRDQSGPYKLGFLSSTEHISRIGDILDKWDVIMLFDELTRSHIGSILPDYFVKKLNQVRTNWVSRERCNGQAHLQYSLSIALSQTH